ncbi:MAG: hypothetical protein M3Z17_08655 [Gemmatimonadota bacterium]|nr:hypothetical protein [Gemmatimonadota bacterium]
MLTARRAAERGRKFARGDWDLDEPESFKRIARSPVELAVITGVLIRLFRALILTHGPVDSLLYLGSSLALGALFLLTMVTLHLGRFPVREWPWRAALFAVIETAAEMGTSLALIAIHREPWGTVRAEYQDWQPMALGVLFWRLVTVTLFALILGWTIHLVRTRLMPESGDDDQDFVERRGQSLL